jgi:tRNA dimethylallyltransferase
VAERLAEMPDGLAVGRDKRPDETRLVATKPLIFVGGTGLYFKALTEGLSPVPSIPDSIRREVRARLEREGAPALHRELDPAMADQLSPTDSQRVARALEVLLATGQAAGRLAGAAAGGRAAALEETTPVVLDPPRDWLEARIRERARTMLRGGAGRGAGAAGARAARRTACDARHWRQRHRVPI